MTPRASRERIQVIGEAIKVFVCAPPVDGDANDAVVRLIAKSLGVAKSSVTVSKGEKSREKVLDIVGIDKQAVLQILSGS